MIDTDADFSARIRHQVDAELERYLEEKREETLASAPASAEMVDAIRSLTMRGGKRLRPIVLAAAYRAVCPDGPLERVVRAGASLELLQSYLLIHDDWMDQDEMRRGGPSVHAIFRNTYGDAHLGDCVGILAGDLASTYAWELMLRVPAPPGRGAELLERFLRIQKEVYCGQHLDVTADADTDRMHDLKTGSYTVRGPLLLGGILGDASSEALSALEAFGDPLGHAFQLRDDLLGTFGDQASLGKPIGSDLRAGKRTALIFEAERALDEEGRKRLHALLGLADPRRAEFGEAELAEAMALLIRSGAKAAVERRLAAYLEQAEAALEGAGFGREGAERLRGVARSLAMRGR